MMDTHVELLNFILNREAARFCRESGLQYHGDPIIEEYHFCNVDREHDRVTKVVKTHIRDTATDQGQLILDLAVARIFNQPETIVRVTPYKDSSKLRMDIAELKKANPQCCKLFRGAYLTFPVGSKNKGVSCVKYWTDRFAALAKIRRRLEQCRTLTDLSATISLVHGFGPFYRNQICTDARYTIFFEGADDWEEFLEAGNGTTRGLRRYHEAHPYGRRKLPSSQILPALFQLRDTLLQETKMPCFRDPNNVANLLCEFDKYLRVKSGVQVALRKNRQPN